ncbi:MAG: glycosyltransferase [Patescibacteria group bacterium]|nr:glycosyltransferase [Patescibacteria group bacterium]MCL5431605.1 glycosyltransferase [Patescibacteria group bacterium]
MPKATVLMPVYNGQKYLKEAIGSILSQTYRDFEFLIIDDGSTDNTIRIIRGFSDSRIHLVKNEKNLGLPRTLNKGIKLAKGKYIARMDSDDISFSNRLAVQVDYMDRHPNIDICGTTAVSSHNSKSVRVVLPNDSEYLRARLLFRTSFIHSSVILRKESLVGNNLFYNPSFRFAEDYELWSRCWQKLRFANIPNALLFYRVHDEQRSQDVRHSRVISQIRERMLEELDIYPSRADMEIHDDLATNSSKIERAVIVNAERWLLGLKSANDKKHFVSKIAMARVLEEQWFALCSRGVPALGLWIVRKYFSSALNSGQVLNWQHWAVVAGKLIFHN